MSQSSTFSGSDLAFKASTLVMSKAVGAIARLLGIVFLARLLPKEDFGVTSFVLITYIAVSTLTSIGLPDSIYFFFEKYPEAKRAVYRRLAALLVCMAVIGAVILLGAAYIAEARGYAATGMILPLILLLFIDLPVAPINHGLIAIGYVKLAASLNVVLSLVLFLALVIPPVLGLPKEAIAYAFLLYGLVRMILLLYFYRRHILADSDLPRPNQLTKELFRYAIPLGIANVTWKLNQIVDKYVVMFFLPVAVFAEYSAGSWEFPVIPIIASSTAMVMMSELIRRHVGGNHKSVAALWVRSIEKISLIVLPLMVLIIVVSEELVITLFSADYAVAWVVFAIYSLSLLQRVCDNGMLLRAINETPIITRWALYTLALNFLLSVPLVIWVGMAGAAVATVCANIVTWFYALRKASNALNVTMEELFPFRVYARTLLVAVMSALPVILIDDYFFAHAAVVLTLKIALYLVVFSIFSLLFRVCSKQDWMFVGRLVGYRPQTGY